MISCCAFRSFDFPLRQGFGGQDNFVGAHGETIFHHPARIIFTLCET